MDEMETSANAASASRGAPQPASDACELTVSSFKFEFAQDTVIEKANTDGGFRNGFSKAKIGMRDVLSPNA